MSEQLHDGKIRASYGTELQEADTAVIMVHGRGDSARGILGLASVLDSPSTAFVAPEATHNTWYPYSFLEPTDLNQPWLDSALAAVGAVVSEVEQSGIPAARIMLLGFSQGACLVGEFAARNPKRYGGLAILSGGLIGPDGTDRDYPGSMDGTEVFLGCSDVDAHIPVERVHETANVLERLGASVTKRIYPNFAHAVNQDEIEHVQAMLARLAGAA